MSNNIAIRVIKMFLGIIFISLGMTFILKAGLGQSTMAGACGVISEITNVRVGNYFSMMNYIFIIVQFIILRKEFKVLQLLQIGVASLQGFGINFFQYDFYLIAHLEPNHYYVCWIFIVIGVLFMSFGVSIVIIADIILMPLEGCCKAIADKTKVKFGTIRQAADFIFIIITVFCLLVWQIPNHYIREGSIFYAFVFGKSINYMIPLLKKLHI